MPHQSLAARLRVAVGVLRGAEVLAGQEYSHDLAVACRQLQGATRALIIAVERLDQTREFAARHGVDDESHV